ncbi:MAG: 50S ribosomal protein L13 [Bacteroidetes bacterium]|nr:50S ribosomal protein L13 [Bacteroidia bacterium]PCH68676.1 MAG: 50S ribosomal protein L13 [Bacteroidota bacterium]
MSELKYKTISANRQTVTKNWVLVDAEDKVLGRLSSEIAKILRGKYKTNFTPHVDCGDNVVVINAEKVRLTGNKWDKKEHITYSGYQSGQKIKSYKEVLDKDGRKVIEIAVKGMLPKNKLGSAIYRNLHVFTGTEHPHEAQKPVKLDI